MVTTVSGLDPALVVDRLPAPPGIQRAKYVITKRVREREWR